MKLLQYTKHFSAYAVVLAATVTGWARVEMGIDFVNNTKYQAYFGNPGDDIFQLLPTGSLHVVVGFDNQYAYEDLDESLSVLVPMAKTLKVYLDTGDDLSKVKCETVFSDTRTTDVATSLASNSDHSFQLRGVISSKGDESCTFTLTAS